MSTDSPSYRLIDEWPANYAELASRELPSLVQVWQERRSEMGDDGRLEQFLVRLRREWAIETGLIERLYSWDRGVTETLIEQGIDAAIITSRTGYERRKAENVRNLVLDQEHVIEGLFEFVKSGGELSEFYIRSLHEQLTIHQETCEAYNPALRATIEVPLLRGQYKKLPNNPRRRDGVVHPYCPAELVTDEMQRLVRHYLDRPRDAAPEVVAAWLHHRFTHIHPFQDGNGRVARSLASLVMLRAGLFPLVLREVDRNQYIEALELADAGDLSALATQFAARQRDVILRALSTGRTLHESAGKDRIRKGALAKLSERHRGLTEKWWQVVATADLLEEQAHVIFKAESELLDAELRPMTNPGSGPGRFNAQVRRSTPDSQHWFRRQILDTANALGGYFVSTEPVHRWVRLSIQTGPIFELVVSIHGTGREFTGVMAASAFTSTKRRQTDSDGFVYDDVSPACAEAFQFNYLEPAQSTQERFVVWIEDVLRVGLAAWHSSLDG